MVALPTKLAIPNTDIKKSVCSFLNLLLPYHWMFYYFMPHQEMQQLLPTLSSKVKWKQWVWVDHSQTWVLELNWPLSDLWHASTRIQTDIIPSCGLLYIHFMIVDHNTKLLAKIHCSLSRTDISRSPFLISALYSVLIHKFYTGYWDFLHKV